MTRSSSTPSKSWVTSAGEADVVRVDQPGLGRAADGATLWLVPADTAGLKVAAPFDGLGLRGNASSPIVAEGARVPVTARLGADGAGLDLAFATVLPLFQVLNASCSLGLADAAIAASIAHATQARFEHLDQTLAEQPVTRQHIARMKLQADAAVHARRRRRASRWAPAGPMRRCGCSRSRRSGSEAALAVTELAMRVGGGAAFRKEVGVERSFRDARAASVMAPTTDALQDFIGRALCGLPLFD